MLIDTPKMCVRFTGRFTSHRRACSISHPQESRNAKLVQGSERIGGLVLKDQLFQKYGDFTRGASESVSVPPDKIW